MCPSHRCWGCLEHPPVLPHLESDWQHWDLSSKLEGGVGFTRPVPSCPSSTVPGTRDGEPASCHGGRGTVPAPYSRLSQFCSGTGMLQICGDLVLLLPGASRSYAAVDRQLLERGQGTLCVSPCHQHEHLAVMAWAGCRAGGTVQAGSKLAGKQKSVWFGLGCR